MERFLSEYGKRAFIPYGFTKQSEETNEICPEINATAGVYMEENQIKTLSSISENFNLSEEDIVQYAPASGITGLRSMWKKDLFRKNPHLENCSFPVVTAGISNSLYVAASLFVDKNTPVLIPYFHWDAYDSIFNLNREGRLIFYDSFSLESIISALNSVIEKKVVVILNYPNNPTGYTPTENEIDIFINSLKNVNKDIVVICDDAYFGLFYENCYTESIFVKLSNLSERVLAVKCDGASKELLMWGQRIGFITFGLKGMTDYSFIENKAAAVNRGTNSSANISAQVILSSNLLTDRTISQKQRILDSLSERYFKIRECISDILNRDSNIVPLPFNSGYFVCFRVNCDSENLRKLLLEKYNVGIIRYDKDHIRIAYSSVDLEKIEKLIRNINEAVNELVIQ